VAEIKSYSINYLDKRIVERSIKQGRLTEEEYKKSLSELPDLSEEVEVLSVNQDEEIEKRRSHRSKGKKDQRLLEAKAKLKDLEFKPTVPTPSPNILDD